MACSNAFTFDHAEKQADLKLGQDLDPPSRDEIVPFEIGETDLYFSLGVF